MIGEYLGPTLIGKDPFHSKRSCTAGSASSGRWATRRRSAALEMALWDMQGKALGRPVCELIGGRTRRGLVEEVTWAWDTPEALAEKTRRMRAEASRPSRSRSATAPSATSSASPPCARRPAPRRALTVDANQGWWDAQTAVRAVKLLEPYGIEFVEQPVRIDDLEAARFVRDRVDTPIALDESVRGPREALACVKAGACDIFVVKLMKTGGILNALKVNAVGEAAGIPVVIGQHGRELPRPGRPPPGRRGARQRHLLGRRPAVPPGGGLARDIGSGLRGEVRDGVSTMLRPRRGRSRHRPGRRRHRGAARDAALVTHDARDAMI